jgi:hypothetical protein
MHGSALVFLSLALATDPVELQKDVHEIQTRKFAMDLGVPADQRGKINQIRLFVSEDRGKTWKHNRDYKPNAKEAIFTAPDDGLYWFSLQVVYKDGKKEPAELDDLEPARKVYVNTERRTLKVRKSYGELLRENEELREKVEQLQQRIKKLEAERKPK